MSSEPAPVCPVAAPLSPGPNARGPVPHSASNMSAHASPNTFDFEPPRLVVIAASVVPAARGVRVEGAVGPAQTLEAPMSERREYRDDREPYEQQNNVYQTRHALLDLHSELRRGRLIPVLPRRFEPHRVAPVGQGREVDGLLAVALAPRLAVIDAVVILHRQVERLHEPGIRSEEQTSELQSHRYLS